MPQRPPDRSSRRWSSGGVRSRLPHGAVRAGLHGLGDSPASKTIRDREHHPLPELGEVLSDGGDRRRKVRGFQELVEAEGAHGRRHGDAVIIEGVKQAECNLVVHDANRGEVAPLDEPLVEGSPAVGRPGRPGHPGHPGRPGHPGITPAIHGGRRCKPRNLRGARQRTTRLQELCRTGTESDDAGQHANASPRPECRTAQDTSDVGGNSCNICHTQSGISNRTGRARAVTTRSPCLTPAIFSEHHGESRKVRASRR